MIKIHSLSVRYQNILALDNVSFEFQDCIIYGIVGKNGAGKSTLLKAIAGLISEYDGSVLFDSKQLKEIKSVLGYSPEDTILLPYLTGREYLELIAQLRRLHNAENEIEELLTNLGMKSIENTLSIEYSHGMKKKLSFAAALLGGPKYLVLDESLNGFDPIALSYAKDIISSAIKKGHHILLASHDIELISELCSTVLLLHDGRLVEHYSKNEMEEIDKMDDTSFRQYLMKTMQISHA
jgi:ABC-2 type transport system ATP-binding protein